MSQIKELPKEGVTARFRLVFMRRKRCLKLSPIPKIRVKIGTDKKGCVHCVFGDYGKQVNPTQYDANGTYVEGQPFFAWISATLYLPDYKARWNRELMRFFWGYIRINSKNLHPADIAQP